MRTTPRSIAKIFLIASAVLLTACAGPQYAFQKESFDSKETPFDHHFAASKQIVFESIKRVALRQGFAVEHEDDNALSLVVSKQYQEDDRNTLLTISSLVTGGDLNADTWVAAQEVTVKSHAVTQTASVGILLGLSIPVPTGSIATLTKERGETIMNKEFYSKIYAAIDKEIPMVKAQLNTTSVEDDARMRADIEKKIRIEMEIRAKIAKEEAQPADTQSTTTVAATALIAKTSAQ